MCVVLHFLQVRKRLNLTWKQRIIGFLITFLVACGFAILVSQSMVVFSECTHMAI